uniref:NADH-ubiquinone oxidoreductase chain 6 n=1 Tax=Diptera sp. 77 LC-2017 TaxID=2030356 RepID=A0A2D1CPY7_9DIPT|nr:NADH dehydrogenase subunit 6 [Diptera sp. 77 LC-2017]
MQFLIFFIMISSITFIFLKHPISMNMNLMIQSFLITIISGLFLKSFWFSYSLFLIFLGGMLILFMYMTSVASNEKFSMKLKSMKIYFMIMFLLIIMSIPLNFKLNLINMIFNIETLTYNNNLNMMINFNCYMLNKLFNFPTNLLSIMLMNFLLITLISSVKISNFNLLLPMRKILK